jgi:ferredoxin-type protein NapH
MALKTSRRLTQLAVALGFPVLAWFNAHNWESVAGNFLSFTVYGLPVSDPLAALQVCLSAWDAPWRLVLGGTVTLAAALVLGTVFCSWVCPFGLLSELAQGLSRRPRVMGAPGWRRKGAAALAGAGMIGGLGLPPLLNQLSLPGWYSRIFQTWFNQQEAALPGLALIVLALGAEAYAGRRLWCRYVCPQSVLLNLVHRISPVGLRVRFDASRCRCGKSGDTCAAACTLGLNPKMAGRGLEWECSTCGDCTQACKARGEALTLGFGPDDGRPFRNDDG